MVGTTLPPGGCSYVCMSLNSNMLEPVGFVSTYRSYSAGNWGSGGGWETEHFGGGGKDCKGIGPIKSFVPMAQGWWQRGPGTFHTAQDSSRGTSWDLGLSQG